MTQIEHLGRQMNNKFLKAAFTDAMERGPYSYILLDFHQKTPEEVRVRTRVLPYEAPQFAYMRRGLEANIINKRQELLERKSDQRTLPE